MSTGSPSSTEKVTYVEVSADHAGQRIDNFLARELKGVPKGLIYRLLRKGQVRVNSARVKADYRVAAGDRLRIPPVRRQPPPEAAEPPGELLRRLEAAILYEDERLIVIDKPAGLAVHGGSGLAFGLIEVLRRLRPQAKGMELAHRLDRGTSGCLAIAKRRSMLRHLHAAFRDGRVEKRYLALVNGRFPKGPVPVESALARTRDGSGEHRVRSSDDGKMSRTVFRVIRRLPAATLVEADIATGRMHQIRVHAAELGYPILGDDKYGDNEANRWARNAGLKRLFLHAASLTLPMPEDGEVVVEAPLDAQLEAVIEALARD